MTDISVLLPLHNGEAFLEQQVRSILAQESVNVRVLILDDGSRDASLSLARALAAADDRVTVLENPQNIGLIATLDRLLGMVETPYFALSDQDDVWDVKKLRISVDFLEQQGHQLVYSDVRIVDAAGRGLTDSYMTSRKIRPVEGRNPVPFVFRNPAIGHTMVGRRGLVQAARPVPRELVFHEAWLVGVACARGTVGFVPDGPLGDYRVHADNVVGPTSASLKGKAAAALRGRGVAEREKRRATALAALATLDPSVAHAAALYTFTGRDRLRRTPEYARFMWQRNRSSGVRSTVVETLMFALGSRRGPERRSHGRSEGAFESR